MVKYIDMPAPPVMGDDFTWIWKGRKRQIKIPVPPFQYFVFVVSISSNIWTEVATEAPSLLRSIQHSFRLRLPRPAAILLCNSRPTLPSVDHPCQPDQNKSISAEKVCRFNRTFGGVLADLFGVIAVHDNGNIATTDDLQSFVLDRSYCLSSNEGRLKSI